MSDQTAHDVDVMPPEDPRLTAYALDELEPAERAEFERQLAESPALRAELDSLRDLTEQLAREFQGEPAPVLEEKDRVTVLAAVKEPAPAVVATAAGPRKSRRWVLSLVASCAVACLAVWLKPYMHSTSLSEAQFESARVSHTAASATPVVLSGPATRFADSDGSESSDEVARVALRGTELGNGHGAVAGGGSSGPNSPQVYFEQERYGKVRVLDPQSAPQDESGAQVADSNLASSSQRSPGEASSFKSQMERKNARESKQTFEGESAASGFYLKDDVQYLPSGSVEGRILGEQSRVVTSTPRPTATPAPAVDGPGPGALPAVKNPTAFRGYGDQPASKKSPAAGEAAEMRDENQSVLAGIKRRNVSADQDGDGRTATDPAAPRSVALAVKEARPAEGKPDAPQTEHLYSRVAGNAPTGGPAASLKWHAEKESRDFSVVDGLGRGNVNGEAYRPIIENQFTSPIDQPLSTFGIDVDTASYSNVRRFLSQNQWPPPDAVRIEELVNYFTYAYPQPQGKDPFAVNVEVGACPWEIGHRLVRIGLKGREIAQNERPASNLVFLVDVSGSMQAENKLPLVKNSLTMLTEGLTARDRIAIVTYASGVQLVLDSIDGGHRQTILNAIQGLSAGGATNGAGGIQLAYETATRHLLAEGTNRVILCTDGDFNVGTTDEDQLVKLVREKAQGRIFLSVFGFGMGNLQDARLEKLADKGNGQYGYIDSLREAQKSFVEGLSGTLVTIAKDVKIQIEFNPAQVGAYRLIGYENRALAAQDFHDDRKDAGEIGAGHTVTALYEIMPPGAVKPAGVPGLKYQPAVAAPAPAVPAEGAAAEMLTLALRFKLPDAEESVLREYPVVDPRQPGPATSDFRWAAAAAAFGMILRDSSHRGQASLDMVAELTQGALDKDASGHRAEFVELLNKARALRPSPPRVEPQANANPNASAEATARAAVNGKYQRLLLRIEVQSDQEKYGAFHDYGQYQGTAYAGYDNLPAGYWVYVAPHWYIWGEAAR